LILLKKYDIIYIESERREIMANKRKITKAEWFEANGFSEDGVTYLVLGNSYPIKDELKDNGFKFSPLLRWHNENCNYKLPENCNYISLSFYDLFTWDESTNSAFMKEGARERIELIFNPPEVSNSMYVGEIGERLHDVPVKVYNIGGFDSAYGYKWVYTFEDENGNRYTWFTTVQQSVSIGATAALTGRIKAHVEYKGVETTQLTRCTLKLD
jgi:hypothetical protein